ncbi:MAG: cupin domain-containing protein [Dyadobacter sp.]|uniref:cupin domain-containing protein n=1 Tax=Dyadobacter sp. TaxID=1914288 RepID=UPI0032659387
MERRNFLLTSLAGGIPLMEQQTTLEMSEDKPLRPFTVPASKPTDIGVGNGVNLVRTMIRQSQTNNHFSCVEVYVAPKRIGPPIHVHKEADELMYVVEGTAGVMIDGEISIIEAGSFNFRPHGLVHTFFNPTDKPLRFIDMFPNQGFEVYLEGMFKDIPAKLIAQGIKPNTPEFVKGMQVGLQELDKRFGVVYFMDDPRYQDIVKKYGLTI